ncbi:MAG: glycosyltransferase family 2 protein, partial [Salinivirgaceae bacterium]|nr:glycosyltransferase family 2 protein [Salinivirgaceae bacterium]
VIPMYNAQETIIKAVSSVLNQTYEGTIELIVVNDGSTDNSLAIIERFKKDHPSLKMEILDQVNGGVQKARNAGLKIAKGQWIALLDSDDYWYPEKTKIQMDILKANGGIDFLGCSRNNEKIKVLWKKKDKLSQIYFKDLLIKMYPQTSTVIFKKSILSEVGLYDEDLRYGEDGDYWLRISLKKQMYFLPETLVTTGDGKPNFGYSGMTAKLDKMEKGNLKVLHKNYILKNINFVEYILLRFYYLLKYIRRQLIVKAR